MLMGTVIAAVLIAGPQAPPDVPKSHWAFPAVDRLFREGLLRGYPARQQPKLVLDLKAKFDHARLVEWKGIWMSKGLLEGYSDHPFILHEPRDPSRYEIAVFVYAAWSYSVGMLNGEQNLNVARETILSQFGNFAEAISMANHELSKLGLDPKLMITKLNELRSKESSLFSGNRR